MTTQYKLIPSDHAVQFGSRLRNARIERNLTLKGVSSKLDIDAGQISRFERGKFVRVSRNLQKYAVYLQTSTDIDVQDSLASRVMLIASKSAKHREAVEEILAALERLT